MQRARRVIAALRPWRFAIAALLVAVAVGVRVAGRDLFEGFGFITLFPTLVVAALFLGWQAGLVVLVGGGLLVWYVVFPPAYSFAIETLSHGIALVLFALFGALILGAAAAFERHLERVEAERRAAAALAERNELLLRELRHRVPNLLQLIVSLIRMRRRAIEDPVAQRAVDDLSETIELIVRAQSAIYSTERAPFDRLLKEVCGPIFEGAGQVDCRIEASAAILPAELNLPMLLTASELILNALKHGCGGRDGGHVSVRFAPTAGGWCLEVADDGPGLPPDFDPEQSTRSGLKLIGALARQMHARFSIAARTDGAGAVARVELARIGLAELKLAGAA
jgi:two-component sensor histidine kinase